MSRWGGYLILNMFVSTTVTVAVLMYWDKYQRPKSNSIPDSLVVANVDSGDNKQHQSDKTIDNVGQNYSTTYRVSSGDTVGRIALEFNLTVEELMEANDIGNPNKLAIDQLLFIPVTQSIEPTNRLIATDSMTSNVAVLAPDSSIVSESSHMLEIRSVSSYGDLESEKLVIFNWGGTVSLLGWSIVSSAGDTYDFPALRLHESGQVTLHTVVGNNTVTDLYWGRLQSAWNSGVTISLIDPSGNSHTSYAIR
jgi:LysM repeat protein